MKGKVILFTMLTTLLAATLLFPAGARSNESDAKAVLKAMSDYVSRQKTIELTFDSDIEVITPQLEKIQFTNSGEALLVRPGKLVIASKTMNSAPQYTLRIKDWKTGVEPPPDTFIFTPPPGAGVSPADRGGPVYRVGRL